MFKMYVKMYIAINHLLYIYSEPFTCTKMFKFLRLFEILRVNVALYIREPIF